MNIEEIKFLNSVLKEKLLKKLLDKNKDRNKYFLDLNKEEIFEVIDEVLK